MKAIVKDRYGSPDVLQIREVEKPQLSADDAILVRVRANSLNAHDWHMLRGKPYIARLSEGLRAPKEARLGLDFAGIAEEVGPNRTDVKPGDHVYGSRYGAFAEVVSGRNVVPMPAGLDFEQAAAVPTAGMTALQGIRDHGGVEAGERVLVIGAGGGVGSFAVQIAKALGAHVTAVTSTKTVEMARSLGADEVVDYTRDDVTGGDGRFDLILDIGGTLRLSRMRRVLTPKGRIVMVAPQPGQWVGPIARVAGALITSRLGSRPIKVFLADPRTDDLLTLNGWIEAGKIRPVIDRTYRFDEIPEGIRYVESGAARGKVVVSL
jgi:NADPH:quinone reductase-like Zn-dependent oxidoreductase